MTLYHTAHSTNIPLPYAVRCPYCQRLTRWLSNKLGQTKCIACVLDEEAKHEAA